MENDQPARPDHRAQGTISKRLATDVDNVVDDTDEIEQCSEEAGFGVNARHRSRDHRETAIGQKLEPIVVGVVAARDGQPGKGGVHSKLRA